MKILFIHQNFPGQFKFLAPELVRQGHHVTALLMRKVDVRVWKGINLFSYSVPRGSTPGVHPWVSDFETKTIRGEACFYAARGLKAQGYAPDVIIAHPAWGESLFIKEVWPQAKLGIYCEFFYGLHGADVGFDPEFGAPDIAEACRLKLKNLNYVLHLDAADAGLAPTEWQATRFPSTYRSKISVIHDGIDTQAITPNPDIRFEFGGGLTLTRADEVVTFVNRNLEPYRGYHIFMRALPELLKERPKAYVLIVGGDRVSYGAPSPDGRSWKDVFASEVRSRISDSDWARVRFMGNLNYSEFIALLQLSSVHVYLTYPFVLSWSLLEAMSAGCAIVASDTAPVREAILHEKTGRLVHFFDINGLVSEITELLHSAEWRRKLGENAREFARSKYDLRSVCLPAQLNWVSMLV